MKKEIEEISKELSLSINEEQAAKLEFFADLILHKNEEINLISRKDTENIWTRHIGDSLAFYPLLKKLNLHKEGLKIADIGAGGGFPSLPLAVILENYFFSLYESSLRKYEFLVWTAMELKLSNVSVFRKRIEKKDRGEFDICLERAAGEPFEIIPLCKNLCRSGGNAVIWQYERNIAKIEKTNPPYFIYNYSVGGEAGKVLLVFRRS
ncbi:MAG: 16S rRNA (guanine(527)-N(7))-methyltransferase RsmG [Elusimicrobia bacterium]|nr:16S rRNA (guanine(527)-N(7))-methyltransferase RsmG [Elusimicrobiota bacterium]